MVERKTIRSNRVREILGDASRSTLKRIRNDPTFPLPLNIHGRPQWYEDEVIAWRDSRPRVAKLPTGKPQAKATGRAASVLTEPEKKASGWE